MIIKLGQKKRINSFILTDFYNGIKVETFMYYQVAHDTLGIIYIYIYILSFLGF